MVVINGSSFMMGCTSEQGQDCQMDEKPAFMTNVDSFCLSKFEVTNLEWWTLMWDMNYSYYDSCHPIESVSWNDIQLFLQRLNQLTGENFRLPTEVEWEFAARGGVYSSGTKYSGSNNLKDVGWCDERRTHRVGLKLPNELGLYDMSGNVSEWCNDEFRSYNNDSSQLYVATDQKEKLRVLRGGCYYFDPSHCRITNRNARPQNRRDGCYGFRLACDRI
jgi:formylglycine-generating enzyme required for sulfatase activity